MKLRNLPAVLGLILLASPAWGATYYIDDSGSPACSDSNAGTSSSAPWCSVDQVNTALGTAAAGDSFLFKAGDTWTYNTAGQWTTSSPTGIQIPTALAGSVGNPITVGSYGAGVRPILDGASGACIGINGANAACPTTGEVAGSHPTYITINGFEIKNTTAYGIVFKNGSASAQPGILIENNFVHNTGPATDNGHYWNQLEYVDYGYHADGAVIQGNTVQSAGGHNAFEIHGDSGGPVFNGNTCIAPANHGCIDMKEAVGGLMEYNVVYVPSGMSSGGEALYYEQSQIATGDITIKDNVVNDVGTVGAAIECGVAGSGNSGSPAYCDSNNCTVSCKVYGNTIYAPGLASGYSTDNDNDTWSAHYCGTVTNDVRDNVFDVYGSGGTTLYAPVACADTWTWNYNLDCASGGVCGWYKAPTTYTTLSSWRTAIGGAAADVASVNPSYVGASSNDFRLRNTSSMIGGGDPSILPTIGFPVVVNSGD